MDRKKQTCNFASGQFTYWGQANNKLHSQYGFVSYLLWCRLEADRISRTEGAYQIRRSAHVKRNGTVARVALFLGRPDPHDHKVLYIGGDNGKDQENGGVA